MTKLLVLIITIFLTTACFKTAEEIKKEKALHDQVDQSAQIIASLTTELTDIKSKLSNTSGQLEEIGHIQKIDNELTNLTFTESFAQIQEQVKVLTEDNTKTKAEIIALKKEVSNQKKYLSKVTSTLAKISRPPRKKKSGKLKKAHKAFEKSKTKLAKKLYNQILKEGSVNNAQKNHIYFNLGLMEYWKKKYENALPYFSKIYTKYPRSSFASRSLLYIGRSFKKLEQTDEAITTFEEVIKKYPKSKHAKLAKEELKK